MADSLFDLGLPDDEDRVKFIAPTPTSARSSAPLAVRMRPQNVDEVLGQENHTGACDCPCAGA